MLDIYFDNYYGILNENIDGGRCELFVLKSSNGEIHNMFIKRPIPALIDGVRYYDIITPYGYGGPIVVECSAQNKSVLIEEYNNKFAEYCKNNNIVSEFVRFHPIYKNYIDFDSVYSPEFSRNTVGTCLFNGDPVMYDFSKSGRKEVKKGIENMIECKIIEHPDNLNVFRKLYEGTMVRNGAADKYFFPDSYYQLLVSSLKEYILEVQAKYNGEIIASELYFTKGDILHAHLLGSSPKLFELSGGALIEATAARWGADRGYKYIHHGGGRTANQDDSLFLYKRKFGKNTLFDFYVGKKIWNQTVYDRLCELNAGSDKDEDFFPKYRVK